MQERIKAVRKDKKLNQTDFGELIGVSRDVIANLEGGRIEPKDIHIRSVCRAFGVSEDWLRTGKGEMYNPPSKNQRYAEIAARLKIEDDNLKTSLCEFIVNADASQLKATLYELVVFLKKSGIDFEL